MAHSFSRRVSPESDTRGALFPVVSLYAAADAPLTVRAEDPFWREAPATIAGHDPFGAAVPDLQTELRSRWTRDHLYVHFRCPYQALYLKPDPDRSSKTWELWNWDVVEFFIGNGEDPCQRYKEFELSPQGEWLDLAIESVPPDPRQCWQWASGFQTEARIDAGERVWSGCMRIPFASIANSPAAPQKTFRMNFYRIEGRPGYRKHIAWRPTHSDSFHVPKAFGSLVLLDEQSRL